MAWAAAIAGILGAAGQIGAGYLGSQGQQSPGQAIDPRYDPYLDPNLQAQLYDSLNMIGFGDINRAVGPVGELAGRIKGLSVDEKTKRRALKYLSNQYAVYSGKSDLKPINEDSGRRAIEKSSDWGVNRFASAATQLGIRPEDLPGIFEREAAFREQQKRLVDSGLGQLNVDTILNRAKAASASAQLLGDAGRFATGGMPSDFQTNLLDRINRNLSDQEEALMLRAQYGGFNPSAGLETLQRARGDSELTALTQAVQAASALTGGLAGGNQIAQASAGAGTNAALSALGLASQQSIAANRLAQAGAQNQYDSLANGLSGGSNSLANTLLLSTILNQKSPGYGNGGGSGGNNSGSSEYDFGW